MLSLSLFIYTYVIRVTVNVEIVVISCQKCIQCLKGHSSLELFFEGVFNFHCFFFVLFLSLSLSFCWPVNVSSSLLSNVSKGHKSLGAFFESVFLMYLSLCLSLSSSLLFSFCLSGHVSLSFSFCLSQGSQVFRITL